MRIVDNAGTPIYAAAFLQDDLFAVAGGGGQGAHGVANKLVVFRVNSGKLVETSQLEFPPNSDSPTSMASSKDGSLWVGVSIPRGNSSSDSNNKNSKQELDRLARFSVDAEGHLSKGRFFNHINEHDINIYQKSISIADTMVATASSLGPDTKLPGVVAVYNYDDEDLLVLPFDVEILGAAISGYDEKYQKYVAAMSADKIEFFTLGKPRDAVAQISAPVGGRWTRIAAAGPGKFVATSTSSGSAGAGAELSVLKIELDESKSPVIRDTTKRIPKFKSVTALAVSGPIVAVASPNGDIFVYDISGSTPRPVHGFKAVHKLPVTALALSADGSTLVSTSMDGSVVVNTGFISSSGLVSATIGWVILSALIIAAIAIALSYSIRLPHGQATPGQAATDQERPKFINVPLQRRQGGGHGPVVHHELTYRDDEEAGGSSTST